MHGQIVAAMDEMKLKLGLITVYLPPLKKAKTKK
jgi:hypothetical protein